MYVCICIYMYVCICMYIYIYTYIYTYVCVCMYMYVYIYIYIYRPAFFGSQPSAGLEGLQNSYVGLVKGLFNMKHGLCMVDFMVFVVLCNMNHLSVYGLFACLQGLQHVTYQEFTRLAETRVAQNILIDIKLAFTLV